jgi:hypothetical protein
MAQEAKEGEPTLKEMEMQPCHGTRLLALRLKHSYDHRRLEELDSGWETYEYKNDWE